MDEDMEFYTYENEKDIYLEGATLFITRVNNKYSNLDLKLLDVDGVHFSYKKGGVITVTVYNSKGDQIAFFDEYKKTKHVGIIDISDKVFKGNLLDDDDDDDDEKYYEYVLMK